MIIFERKHQPLATRTQFFWRMIYGLIFGVFVIAMTIYIGMLGLNYFENLSWLDSFANSAMIISGVGAINPIITSSGKFFAGMYSIVGNVVFIVVIGIIFLPVVHRYLHKFHLDQKG